MAITVKCDSCGQQYQVRDTLAGKSVVCKACGAGLPVAVAPARNPASDDETPDAGYEVTGASETQADQDGQAEDEKEIEIDSIVKGTAR